MALFVLVFLPVGVAASALHNVTIAVDLGTAILVILLSLVVLAMGQMTVLYIRSEMTASYIRRGNTEPLDSYEGGYPTRYDFWVAAAVPVAVCGLL